MRYLNLIIWAAMHDKYFQERHFFVPPRISIYNRLCGVEINLIYPYIGDPFPSSLYESAGLVPAEYCFSGSPDDVPF